MMPVSPLNAHSFSHAVAAQPRFSGLISDIKASNHFEELQLQRQQHAQQQKEAGFAERASKAQQPLLTIGENQYSGVQLLQLVQEELKGQDVRFDTNPILFILDTLGRLIVPNSSVVDMTTIADVLDPTVERLYQDAIQNAFASLGRLGFFYYAQIPGAGGLTDDGNALLASLSK